MVCPVHPARQMPFATLMAGLERARALGFVRRRVNTAAGLQLFIYTPRCAAHRKAERIAGKVMDWRPPYDLANLPIYIIRPEPIVVGKLKQHFGSGRK
jgi:hypothetical protein